MTKLLPDGWEFCTPEEAVFQLPNSKYQSLFWLQDQIHAMGWMKDRDHSVMLAGHKERGRAIRPQRKNVV